MTVQDVMVWQSVWRKGIAPSLPTDGLLFLYRLLATDDERLIQGATCSPPPLQAVQDWPIEAGDAIIACFWKGEPITVQKAEEAFAKTAYECDMRMGETAVFRHYLNWYDDTPRPNMRRELLREVTTLLCQRHKAPFSDDTPAVIVADWMIEHDLLPIADVLQIPFTP